MESLCSCVLVLASAEDIGSNAFIRTCDMVVDIVLGAEVDSLQDGGNPFPAAVVPISLK